MAKKKRNRYLDILNDPDNFYAGWLPRDNQSVWVNKEVYAEINDRLRYLTDHPELASPDRLLALVNDIIGTWNSERRAYRKEFNALIEAYSEAVRLLNEQDAEFVRLNGVINALHERINEAVRRQNELQANLDELRREKVNDANLAIRYRNEAVQLLNSFIETVYFEKYASGELEGLRHTIEELDSRKIADSAKQGLALICITNARTLQKKVERKKADFEILYIAAMHQAEELKRCFESWGNDTYFDEARQNKVDMDYWSRGEWSRAYSHMTQLYDRVRTSDTAVGYSIEDLKSDIENMVELKKAGEEIVRHALGLSYQSEMAQAMGQIIASIMSEMFHFRAEFMGYNNDDERESYVVQMYSHTYEIKIQFVITPMSEKSVGCIYHASTDKYIREEYLDEIIKHIVSELQYNDVTMLESPNKEDSHWVPELAFVPKGHKCTLEQSLFNQ